VLPQLLRDPVRISNLKKMGRSAAHYRAAILEPTEPTAPMRFGRVVHAVAFRQPFQVWSGQRRGQQWAAFAEQFADELIVTSDELERAQRCVDAIGATANATPLLCGVCETEVKFRTLGRDCVAHLDVNGQGFVTELKTSSSVEPMQFIRGALRLGYHAQLAWYLDAIGHPDWAAHIVAVEVAPPFAVQVFTLTPRAIEAGRRLCRLWLERLLVCESANEWPGYCQSVVPFDVPDESQPLIIDGEEVEAA